MKIAHAEEIEVDEELQDVRNMRLVRLELFAEDRSAVKKVRDPPQQVWIVQLDPEELVLSAMISIVRAKTNFI